MIQKTFISDGHRPSLQEIRTACRRIRRGWSNQERMLRQVSGRRAWRLLVFSCPAFAVERSVGLN